MSFLVNFTKFGLVPLSAVAIGFGGYEWKNNPAFPRAITLWRELGPIITHYRIVEARLKYSPSWLLPGSGNPYQPLHERYSSKVMETLRDLRGFYIKVAQIMANRSDVLPPIYTEKLRVLEDAVPPLLSGPEAKEFIRVSLGLENLEDEIVDFVLDPIGSASIGQVHKAKLKRNGRDVAIKIQGPGSEELFRMDISAARNFCRVFAPEQVAVFDEIEAQFLTEFDYRKEADNLEIIGKNMKEAGFSGIVIPQPYKDLCSKVILVMDYLKGPKLVDGARLKGREYAKFLGKSYEELEDEWKENIRLHGMPKPYDGPTALQLEIYKSFIVTKDRFLNLPVYILNSSLSFFYALTGIRLRDQFSYFTSFVPLNSSFIMDTLLKTHGHQLLINGFFNADPHPGLFFIF